MPAALRQLCFAIAVLIGAFAVPARADDGGRACCAGAASPAAAVAAVHVTDAMPVAQEAIATAAPEVAEHCACGSSCHCAERSPQRGCDCTKKAPKPKPEPAAPSLPKPPPGSGAEPAAPRAQQIPPDLTTAAKLRAATASGLPHVLLPGRSRQIALSVWRC